MRLLLPGIEKSCSEARRSVPSLEQLGCKPCFNEASVLRWLFFVPVHMLPRWQSCWRSSSVVVRMVPLCCVNRLLPKVPSPMGTWRNEC